MRKEQMMRNYWLGGWVALGLMAVACTTDDPQGLPVVTRRSTSNTGISASHGILGGIGSESLKVGSQDAPAATPGGSASALPDPALPSPEAAPTAAPRAVVREVRLAPSRITLAPPPSLGGASLGLISRAQFVAYADLADGSQGTIRWIDRSGGQLEVGADGTVTASATASPGTYVVRAQALDDPRVFADALVEVRTTGGLDLIVE